MVVVLFLVAIGLGVAIWLSGDNKDKPGGTPVDQPTAGSTGSVTPELPLAPTFDAPTKSPVRTHGTGRPTGTKTSPSASASTSKPSTTPPTTAPTTKPTTAPPTNEPTTPATEDPGGGILGGGTGG
jgi:serine/threonine-protein kinase